MDEAQILAGLVADSAREVFALFIIVAQRARAGRGALAKADAPGRHGHAVGDIGRHQMRQRIRIGIVFLIRLENLVEVVKRLRRVKAFLLQIVLAHNQAAVIEGLVEKLRHEIALAVLQLELIHFLLQTQFFHHGVEVGRPFRIIADGHNASVEREGRIFTLRILIQNDVRQVHAGIQRGRNPRGKVRGRDGLDRHVQPGNFCRRVQREPTVHKGKRGVVGVPDAYLDGRVFGDHRTRAKAKRHRRHQHEQQTGLQESLHANPP